MALWTAFTLGFLGSFHCVGMCGPIALALPNTGKGKVRFLSNRLTYNIGRITTYAAIGFLFGLLGKGFAFAGLQKGLSISLGLLVIIAALFPLAISPALNPAGKLGTLVSWLKQKMQLQFRRRSYASVYTIGLLNGLLPCGLIYLAAAAAVTSETPLEGALYMAAFGAGTLPAMLVVVFAGNFLNLHWRNAIRRILPVAGVLTGLLLIVRGLELDIPFSPVLELVEEGMTMCGLK
ncbi:sulfite exporter TauE/SafE family protein [Nafulsella turpanensis]|uniref:sulfite exporter TauE/SafE family protein n=1 Tax=Nafulsella turpanensis TaxID=1265690 RepID=UPI00047755E7|nr:sulfite exporter TauE/SafE family protein [Nafulsella turpanensis]